MAKEHSNYKDTVFRMVFKDKENLLSLYNAVNGTDYKNPEELELTVHVFNINFGKNKKLLDTCQKLKEYAQYVDRIRRYAKEMPPKEAIERAITECIKEGILSDFLKKNRAEALEMSWYEYNEELHLKSERQIAHEEWIEHGMEQGDIKYILRMHKNGYPLSKIAQIADKTLEEVRAVIDKEESALIP